MNVNIKVAYITAAATIAAAVVVGIFTITGNVSKDENVIINIGNRVTENKKVDETSSQASDIVDNLEKIFIGIGRRYVENLFGIPIIEKKHEKLGAIEVNYSFKKFYLQFLYDKNDVVKFYSLTSKDKKFKPVIPGLNKILGEHTFYEYGEIPSIGGSFEYTYLYSYLSSKHYGYGEYLYLGNAGNYHNYYLGYNSAGVDYGRITPFTNYEKNRQQWEDFRHNNMPNTFGIGNVEGLSEEEVNIELGIDYYTSRDIQ